MIWPIKESRKCAYASRGNRRVSALLHDSAAVVRLVIKTPDLIVGVLFLARFVVLAPAAVLFLPADVALSICELMVYQLGNPMTHTVAARAVWTAMAERMALTATENCILKDT